MGLSSFIYAASQNFNAPTSLALHVARIIGCRAVVTNKNADAGHDLGSCPASAYWSENFERF